MRNFAFILLMVVVPSCVSNSDSDVTMEDKPDSIISIQELHNQTTSKTKLDSTTIESYEQEDMKRLENEMEIVFGKQWDFCDCVDKTDSIQKAIEAAGDLTDTEFDGLMNRFEAIDRHCKTLIAGPNATPEERKIHERKVKKCLKNKS